MSVSDVKKRLTVVTTTFKSAPHLALFCSGVQALDGLDQIEVVLVMNEPDSAERRIVADLVSAIPETMRVIEVERESIGASLNRGLLGAQTTYCAFLDVDDTRVPDSFLNQMAVLDSHPEADFTYGDHVIVRSQGSTDGRRVYVPEFETEEFRRSCIASPTQLFRRSLVDQVGGLDEQFRSGGDYEFQIRAAMSARFVKTPGLMLGKTSVPGSASGGRLQPVERTAVELRYALYDKTIALAGYPFVEEARQYRLGHVLLDGRWHEIEEFVPGYAAMMFAHESERCLLDERLARWRRREIIRGPMNRVVGAGIEALRHLRRAVRSAGRGAS